MMTGAFSLLRCLYFFAGRGEVWSFFSSGRRNEARFPAEEGEPPDEADELLCDFMVGPGLKRPHTHIPTEKTKEVKTVRKICGGQSEKAGNKFRIAKNATTILLLAAGLS